MKFGFLAFSEAKTTRIVILDQKLNVPNDDQQFWVHFQARSTQKWYFLVSNPIFQKKFSMVF